MATITAFIGVKGSGKDYQSDKRVAAGAVRVDFKDALIEMAEDLVGFPIRSNYEAFKEQIVGFTGPQTDHPSKLPLHKLTAEILEFVPEAMTGRRLLQRLGTEVIKRKRDPDYWAGQFRIRVLELIEAGKDVVCADCRFPNEVDVIERIGMATDTPVQFIFCDYHSLRYDATDTHPSEAMAQAYLNHGLKDGEVIAPIQRIK